MKKIIEFISNIFICKFFIIFFLKCWKFVLCFFLREKIIYSFPSTSYVIFNRLKHDSNDVCFAAQMFVFNIPLYVLRLIVS